MSLGRSSPTGPGQLGFFPGEGNVKTNGETVKNRRPSILRGCAVVVAAALVLGAAPQGAEHIAPGGQD